MIQAICQTCDITFQTKKHGNRVPRFHNKKCAGTAFSTKVDVDCATCGRTFKARPDNIAKGFGRFHNKACANIARKKSLVDRFWAKVDRQGPDDCWLFTGARDGDGYGLITSEEGRDHQLRAPRVSYEIANGPIPAGRMVMHRCDNPPCVNPGHLRVGTTLENNRDKAAKGRAWRGGPRPKD